MYFQGTNDQIAFVGWDNTKNEWKFIQRPIVYENGSLYDLQSCSERIEIELWEYDNYGLDFTQRHFDVFEQTVVDGKFMLKVSSVFFQKLYM